MFPIIRREFVKRDMEQKHWQIESNIANGDQRTIFTKKKQIIL